MVTDAEIDALVKRGWDWHSAYLHLQAAAHRASFTVTPPAAATLEREG